MRNTCCTDLTRLRSEVAARIEQIRPGISVLYMSGYAQPVLAAQGTLEPGITLVENPASAAELLAQVRRLLDARPTQDGTSKPSVRGAADRGPPHPDPIR